MKRILIVDDQACVRELISEELTDDGYRVTAAGDRKSVKAQLSSLRPDLVLLDLYLDGPDGFELFRHIKRQDPDLPVIIVTAYDSFSDDPRLSQADGYVLKSLDFAELKQKVADVLGQKSVPQVKKVLPLPIHSDESRFMRRRATATRP